MKTEAHGQLVDGSDLLSDCEDVEQCLSGMLSDAVASVDDLLDRVLGRHSHGVAVGMANDERMIMRRVALHHLVVTLATDILQHRLTEAFRQ